MRDRLARALRLSSCFFKSSERDRRPRLMDTRGVIYQYTGPPKVPPCGTYAMRRRGPKCRGFPRAGNGIGEVLNITAPCVWESEASFMITLERSKAKTVRGSLPDFLRCLVKVRVAPVHRSERGLLRRFDGLAH